MSIKNEFTRVFDILAYQLARYPQENAVNTFSDTKWQHVSTAKLLEKTAIVACWLLAQGYKKGDKLGIIPRHGSLDWLIIDFACQQIGIIIIPLHASSSREELTFILSETNPVLLIVADNELHENYRGLHANDGEIRILSLSTDNEHTFQDAHGYVPVESEREELTNIKKQH